MTPHQKQVGAEFLSLGAKISDFWLEQKRNCQSLNKKHTKEHSNTMGTIYIQHLAEHVPMVSPLGK
jgi:hypothetical protein